MRRPHYLLVLSVFAFATSAYAEESTAPNIVEQKSVILRISADPASGLANETLVEVLLTSSLDIRSRAVAKVSPEAASSGKWTARLNIGGNTDFGQVPHGIVYRIVNVITYDERVPVDKFIKVYAQLLTEELRRIDPVQNERIRHDALRDLAEYFEAEMQNLQSTYTGRAIASNLPMSPAALEQLEIRMGSQLDSVQTQIEGLVGRQKAIEDQVARLAKDIDAATGQDPIVLQLEKAVAIHREIVASRREAFRQDEKRKQDLLAAEGDLAELEAELAKTHREAHLSAGGQRMRELQIRLEDTTIELKEANAKRTSLESAKTNLLQAIPLKNIQQKMDQMRATRQTISAEQENLNLKEKLYMKPTVDVIFNG